MGVLLVWVLDWYWEPSACVVASAFLRTKVSYCCSAQMNFCWRESRTCSGSTVRVVPDVTWTEHINAAFNVNVYCVWQLQVIQSWIWTYSSVQDGRYVDVLYLWRILMMMMRVGTHLWASWTRTFLLNSALKFCGAPTQKTAAAACLKNFDETKTDTELLNIGSASICIWGSLAVVMVILIFPALVTLWCWDCEDRFDKTEI